MRPSGVPALFKPGANAPQILTPPTGIQVGRQRRKRKKHHSLASAIIAFVRGAPTRVHFAAAAALYGLVPWILDGLQRLSLRYDDVFSDAVYLRWSGTTQAAQYITPLLEWLTWVPIVAAVLLVASALLPHERMFKPVHAVARRFYRYAIALPLWTILVANADRFIDNEAYRLGPHVVWDVTPLLAKLEGPFIGWLQQHTANPVLSEFASTFDSAIWVTPMVVAGVLLVAIDRPRVMNGVILAYALTVVVALPLFVLLPAFDPWTTNTLYGAKSTATHIRFLYTNSSLSMLRRITAQDHWAAGLGIPNLHVALPLVGSFILRRQGLRAASLVMAVIAAVSAFVALYLGRGWLIGCVAAIPLSMAVVSMVSRSRFDVVASLRKKTPPILRPGEVAAPSDPRVDAVQWLAETFFVSGFAAFLYQVVWQRALVGIVGSGESVALTFAVLASGLGVGVLVGGAVSRRTTIRIPLVFAFAHIGLGIFGVFSMSILQYVGRGTVDMSATGAAAVAFLVLLVPTILMGATLPLLVMNQVRVQRSLGVALGQLHFMMALGAAVAAGLTGVIVLGTLGQFWTVQVAAALDLGIAALVLVRVRRLRHVF